MPCDYKLYPKNWKEIVEKIRIRSKNRCELCNAPNNLHHWKTGSKVVLTVAHLTHKPKDCRMYAMLHLCQRCHNKIDIPWRIDRRKK